ncbi:PREDICTED: probable flavin-containing [Prunus dulcis]|uniref:Flavin-containing monooxygenase n=1 Tax=Prunus dulcis TaxID=3755 RepID=A0A5E4FGV0_PRUDU|nr:PREDICTED: probable flavin-containing [Prunus dulcis]
MGKQVAIIGAGISGLLACKYTLSKGFQPIVFEASSSIGGVWTKTVETTRIQSPKDYYQFSDFPWPSSVTEGFPTQNQVLDYVKSYAQHFELLKHIKFNTKVCGIEYEGPSSEDEMQAWSLWGGNGEPFSSEGKWKVVAEDKHSISTEIHLVDFVILCLGRFSDVPNIPDFHPNKGPEAFHGEVIHSMNYADMDYVSAANLVKGKQVTVVGFQKFAMDIAMECSNANGVELPCTVIYKTEHWNLPDYLPWGLPLAYLYFSRFSELLVHKPGTFKLPSIKEMEKDVEKWDKYAKQYASVQYYRRSCIGALHLWYNDQLCKDMGWNHKRKKGVFAELFEPYGPMDYVTS